MRNRAFIKARRKSLGWSQVQAARKVGLSRSHYANLENGWRSFTPRTYGKVARALRI